MTFKRVFAGHEVDDFKSVSQDSDGKSLLTSVSASEHKSIDESFNDWALSLSELLNLPSASSVRDVDLGLEGADGDVVLEADVLDLNLGVIPASEKLSASALSGLNWGLSGFWDFGFNF